MFGKECYSREVLTDSVARKSTKEALVEHCLDENTSINEVKELITEDAKAPTFHLLVNDLLNIGNKNEELALAILQNDNLKSTERNKPVLIPFAKR